ncbi:MAG: hypothetical protein ACYC6X_02845 [Minisyncoccota bacterium]
MNGTPERAPTASSNSTLYIVKTVHLEAIGGRETNQCFTDSRYVCRDPDFDKLLPDYQPPVVACDIEILASTEEMSFLEWVATKLGVPANTNIEVLEELLKKNGYAIKSLVQFEKVIGDAELEVHRGTLDPGISIDGSANFAFVEKKDGRITAVHLHRLDVDPDPKILNYQSVLLKFDYGFRFPTGSRLVLPRLNGLLLS